MIHLILLVYNNIYCFTINIVQTSNGVYCLHLRSFSGPINVLVIGDSEEKRFRHKRTFSETSLSKIPRLETGITGITSLNDNSELNNEEKDTTDDKDTNTSDVIKELIKSHSMLVYFNYVR